LILPLKIVPHQILVRILLVLLLGASIYRAATLAISMDEAYTYLSFVAPPLKQILTTYSPNHNVLYSLLAKASVHAFGVSELSLRVPALVGGLLSLIAIVAMSRILLRSELTILLSVCLIALNPMIFDYMSEARGYSLALAFYLLGLLRAVPALLGNADHYRSRLACAGALLGLSVAAHLSFGIPVIALDLIFTAVCLRFSFSRAGAFLAWLLLPQIGVAAAITIGPLIHAQRQEFVGGYTSAFQTLNNFAISCLLHDWDGNGVWTYQVNTWVSGWFYTVFRCIFLLVIGAAVFVIGRAVLSAALGVQRNTRSSHQNSLDPRSLWLLVCAGTLLFSILIVIAAHALGDAPYPFARFVLYWWPLWVFTTCMLIERFRPGAWPLRSLSALLVVFCVLMAMQSGLQLDLDHFGWLRYSAGTKQIADFIRRKNVADGGPEVTISTSGSLYACLDFYRSMYSMSMWRLRVRSDAPDGDFIVMDAFDRPKGIPPEYDLIWQDPLSKAVIAARRD
jgi:hypothetical protein